MNTLDTGKTIGAVAAENPGAARIFEKLGIDYCCGGGRTLEQACRAAGVTPEDLAVRLEQEGGSTGPAAGEPGWTTASLADLMGHICNTHHRFTRAEIERLGPLFEKVYKAHGANHPELAGMRDTFAGLAAELTSHLMKEEVVLFPYIARLEKAEAGNFPIPRPPFGTVRNPIAMMASEHDGAGEALRQLRAASGDYAVPVDGCASFRTLFEGLAAFEADLHRHIHLENNVLFPRAIEMERRAADRG